MAGNYPDPPAVRIPYDRDGTQVVMRDNNSSVITKVSSTVVTKLNNESNDHAQGFSSSPYSNTMTFIFPRKKDLTHYFLASTESNRYPNVSTIQTSPDTTNGVDGTWTTWVTGPAHHPDITPDSRTMIQAPSPVTGVRAIRINMTGGFASLGPNFTTIHLYGTPTLTYTRLEMWHPTLDQPLSQTPAHLDWGDRERGGTVEVRQFRVKNMSAALTAQAPFISLTADPDDPVPWNTQYSFRDQTQTATYTTSLSLLDLGPGAISPVVDIRQEIDPATALSLHAQRIIVQASDWV